MDKDRDFPGRIQGTHIIKSDSWSELVEGCIDRSSARHKQCLVRSDSPSKETCFCNVTFSKIVFKADTRKLLVRIVQVNDGLLSKNDVKSTKSWYAPFSWRIPVVFKSGTPWPPGEQIAGS